MAHPTGRGQRVCTNFDADATALLDTFTPTSTPDWVPVYYRYCEDYRGGTRTIPWCNTFDEGDSFRDMVRNAQEAYERSYVFSAFRRYRRSFSIGGYMNGLTRYFLPLINIEQNLLYRYASDPEFREQEGAWGFYDQFLATADTLNFFARVLAQPAVGPYFYSPSLGYYIRRGTDPTLRTANFGIDLGQGRFSFSVYQSGLNGVDRLERVGSIYDKILALQLLTVRGLSPFYGTDAVFYTNFYDLFPLEMNQLFGGMIADDPRQYAPRVRCEGGGTFPTCRDPRVVYMNFYRGDCREGSTTCRPESTQTYSGLTPVDGGDSFLLQSYAAIFGLSEFPVYYDTTFQQQLFLCIEGRGDCQVPPASAREGVDFVRYTSPRLYNTYIAWQLTPSGSTTEQSVSFRLVREARERNLIVQSLREYRGDYTGPGTAYQLSNITQPDELAAIGYAIPSSPTVVDADIDANNDRVEALESFFNYLIQLERQFGINYPQIYTRPEL